MFIRNLSYNYLFPRQQAKGNRRDDDEKKNSNGIWLRTYVRVSAIKTEIRTGFSDRSNPIAFIYIVSAGGDECPNKSNAAAPFRSNENGKKVLFVSQVHLFRCKKVRVEKLLRSASQQRNAETENDTFLLCWGLLIAFLCRRPADRESAQSLGGGQRKVYCWSGATWLETAKGNGLQARDWSTQRN